MTKWIVVETLWRGFMFHGPFDDAHDAGDYASHHLQMEEWNVAELVPVKCDEEGNWIDV